MAPARNTKRYTVRPGDSLDSIARAHGAGRWERLYHSSANAGLRRKRQDPSMIHPGDVIALQWDSSQVIDEKIARLQELRRSMLRTQDEQLEYLRKQRKGVERMTQVVETATFLVGIARNLTRLTANALRAGKASGKELAKLNRAVTKDAFANGNATFHHAGKQIAQQKLDGSSARAEDGLLWAYGRKALQAYLDWTSLSYWLKQYVRARTGETPEQTISRMEAHVREVTDRAVQKLDRRVSELRSAR